jgi:tRNA(Ile)-lysidine synthetase-like protein
VLVAISGGGDSVGLLAFLLSALPRPGLVLGVAHVHHNLRGSEADRDRAAVRDLARSLGLPFSSARLKSRPPKGDSVEAWARTERYAALERLRLRGKWDLVATAHTLDDQAETVLMRIARGTGLQGLSGILARNGKVVRPALGLRGAELREAARSCGLAFLEDSSNSDRRFLRNRVRREVLPAVESALPGFSRRLAALARLASEAAPPAGSKALTVAVLEADGLYYERADLAEWTDGEGLAALREGIRAARGHLGGLTERHLRALWSLRTCRPGAAVPLPGGWEGTVEGRRIRIGPRREP